MKRISRCEDCHKIVRTLGSYKAKLETEEQINGMYTGRLLTRVVCLCKNCAGNAGYIVERKKKVS